MKLDLFNTLRARGWNGIGFVHLMGWFGSPGHYYPMTAYKSNNPLTIGKQLSLYHKAGVGGVCLTWQGVTVNPFLHQVAIEMSQQCAERGMLFALCLDPWICKGAIATAQAKQPNTPLTAAQISAIANPLVAASLNDPTVQTILNSPSYISEKYLLDFGTGASLVTLGSMFPKLNFLAQNTGFAWPPIQDPIASIGHMNNLVTMRCPAFFSRFFDGGVPSTAPALQAATRGDGAGKDYNSSQWSTPGLNDSRCIESQAGNVAILSAATIPITSKYAFYVTGNDYSERTEIESALALLTNTLLS